MTDNKESETNDDVSKNDDNPLAVLLKTCQESPSEGLRWIDEYEQEDADLRENPDLMFCRFVALRTLALEDVFGLSVLSLAAMDEEEMSNHISTEQMAYAGQALKAVAQIEHAEIGYFDERAVAVNMVDGLCNVIERLRPGSVQEALGWTKLCYFGTSRVGNLLPDFFENTEDALMGKTLGVKISPRKIVRSALGADSDKDKNGRWYVRYVLMEKNFRTTPTVGDAKKFCLICIFEDGKVDINEFNEDWKDKLSKIN